MQEFKTISFFSELRKALWPIEWHENKKFILMFLILNCVAFNYVLLKSVKDILVITHIGVEAISFLKLYFVLPLSFIMIILYIKLYNIISQERIFYIFTSCFIGYFAFCTFILYPNPEIFHPTSSRIDSLVSQYPAMQWFIKIAAHWGYASFYIISEMWSMMLGLFFWQLANQITNISEAKRFYPMFGLLGGILSLFVTMPIYVLEIVL